MKKQFLSDRTDYSQLVTKILRETQNDDGSDINPSIELEDLESLGISTKGFMTEDERRQSEINAVYALLHEALKLGIKHPELNEVCRKIQKIKRVMKENHVRVFKMSKV